jgi:hypothetical protein
MIEFVNKSFHKVRNELAEVGLLARGRYLDSVDLYISALPSAGEAGYVFESAAQWRRTRFKPGVIYLPSDLPQDPKVPGYSLADTIRHEYAHTWYCLDPAFFRESWFIDAFGASYANCNPKPLENWRRQLHRDDEYSVRRDRCRSEVGKQRLFDRYYRQEFITDYASNCASEDFAETFMFFLRYRRSLERYQSRPRVYHKLMVVQRAVERAGRRLRQRRFAYKFHQVG